MPNSRKFSAERLLGNPVYVAIAVAILLIYFGSLADPTGAAASLPSPKIPIPLPNIPNPLDAVGSVGSALDPGSWVVDGFKAILQWIFGDKIDEIGKNLINMLLAVPLLADGRAFKRLNDYREYVTYGAWSILSLTFVVASMRYWLAGFAGGGAYEALTGFIKSIVAVVALLIYVPMFDMLSRIVNAFTSALVINPVVGNGLHDGIGTFASADFVGGGITMMIAIASLIMAIVLLIVKVTILVLLAILYISFPLAVALWPIEELSWPLRTCLQAMAALLMFPIIWALCFAVFSLLPADALFPGQRQSFVMTIMSPLVQLATLIIAFRLPFAFLKQGMQYGISPGIGRGVAHARMYSSVVPNRTSPAPAAPSVTNAADRVRRAATR